MSQKRPHSPPPSPISPVYTALPIHDRSSTFKAVYSPSISARSLRSLPSLSTATHRIAAWRVPSKQSTLDAKIRVASGTGVQLYDAGHDSDGEKGAGRRLERLMADEGVEGSLVVGRWFGGVMLGPVRFSHIEEVAKRAVRAARSDPAYQQAMTRDTMSMKRARVVSNRSGSNSPALKKPVDEETENKKKTELMATLKERDGSIAVLRQLLEEKKARIEGRQSTPVTPAKTISYPRMPYPALRALEKVRDATVAFLLKELDKADQAQQEEDELNAAFLAVEEVASSPEGKRSERKRTYPFEGDLSKQVVVEEDADEQAWSAFDEARRDES